MSKDSFATVLAPHQFAPRTELFDGSTVQVLFTWEVYRYLRLLVSMVRGPISWVGTVEQLDAHTYAITHVFLPPQEVTHAGATITADDWAQFHAEIMAQYPGDEGVQIMNSLNFWGHTSTTNTVESDREVRDLFAKSGKPWCIFANFSTTGKIELSLHQLAGMPISCYDVPWGMAEEEDEALTAEIKATVAAQTRRPGARGTVTPQPPAVAHDEFVPDTAAMPVVEQPLSDTPVVTVTTRRSGHAKPDIATPVVVDTTPSFGRILVDQWKGENQAAFVSLIEQRLLPTTTKDIVLHSLRPYGGRSAPVKDGRLHFWFFASLGHMFAHIPQMLWGISVESRETGFQPSGYGIPIRDSNGWPAGELVGDNVYIHWNCSSTGSDRELRIFDHFLAEVVRAMKSPPVAPATDNTDDDTESATDTPILDPAAKLAAELEKMKHLEHVTGAEMRGQVICVFTDTICCTDPRTKRVHEIGKFGIEIDTQDCKNGVRWHNLDRTVRGYCTPYLYTDDTTMPWDLRDIVPPLLEKGEFAIALTMAIMFVEEVRPTDGGSFRITDWPEVKWPGVKH